MIRHVQSNTATRTFSSRNDTVAVAGVVFLRVACHLQTFLLVRRMEEQQDGSGVRAMEMFENDEK